MEILNLKENIEVLCRRVSEFPKGVKDAFTSLMHDLPDSNKRDFYGISYMDEKGGIVYKAGATFLPGDSAEKYSSELFKIPKGDYLGETLLGWMSKKECIKDIFGRLMKDPRFDDGFPCVEWYKSDDDLFCMVKIRS